MKNWVKWVLSLAVILIALWIYRIIILSYASISLSMFGTSVIFSVVLFVLIAGLILGFISQLIVYKWIKIESKNFFYVALILALIIMISSGILLPSAVTVISTAFSTGVGGISDITAGAPESISSAALSFISLVSLFSFSLSFAIRQAKLTEKKWLPWVILAAVLLVEYFLISLLA